MMPRALRSLLRLCAFVVISAAVMTSSLPRSSDPRPPTLYVQPVNGLSNRLRVLTSARALARRCGYRLVVVWEPDVQCNVTLDRLLRVQESVVDGASFVPDATTRRHRDPRAILEMRRRRSVFVQSAFVLRADVAYEHLIAHEFRILEPSPAVLSLVSDLEEMVHGVHEVAVHVRMLTDFERDVPGLDEDTRREFERRVTDHRVRCHWRHFVAPMRHVGVQRRSCTIDSDSEAATAQLARTFPGCRVLPHSCVGRGRRRGACVEHAFAHILFMARAQVLVLSDWSSYSELIRWFAPRHSLAIDGCRPPPPPPPADAAGTTSIVVACRDRATATDVIERALAIGDRATTEVVVVDWGSAPRVAADARGGLLRVVRLQGVEGWNLAQAYNVAIRAATGRYVLKIDCDTRLECLPSPPRPLSFRAGNWETHGSLNGIVHVARSALEAAGGYDERLTRYGWDDSDLFRRLRRLGNGREEIDARCFRHIPHADGLRGVASAVDGLISTQMNRLCVGDRGPWSPASPSSEYRSLYNRPNELLQIWHPAPIQSTSATCDDRLATAIVLARLFSRCNALGCVAAFWRVARQPWIGVREFVTRLAPGHEEDALACVSKWPSFAPPTTVGECNRTLRWFDARLRP